LELLIVKQVIELQNNMIYKVQRSKRVNFDDWEDDPELECVLGYVFQKGGIAI
jgi:hypothetical protein